MKSIGCYSLNFLIKYYFRHVKGHVSGPANSEWKRQSFCQSISLTVVRNPFLTFSQCPININSPTKKYISTSRHYISNSLSFRDGSLEQIPPLHCLLFSQSQRGWKPRPLPLGSSNCSQRWLNGRDVLYYFIQFVRHRDTWHTWRKYDFVKLPHRAWLIVYFTWICQRHSHNLFCSLSSKCHFSLNTA